MTAADAGEALSARTRSASPSDRMPRKPATSYEVVRNARPLLCGPPALDALRRHRNRSADRARRGEGAGGCGAAHRPRHARGEAERRGGLVRRRAPARRRGGVAAPARPLPRLRHRHGDPPSRPRRLRDREGGAGRRRLRLRGPSVLRGVRALQAPGHAVRRPRLRRPPRHRAVEHGQRRGRAAREHPRRAALPRDAGAGARPPARAQHARLGRAVPDPEGRGDRRRSTRTSTASESGRSCRCG